MSAIGGVYDFLFVPFLLPAQTVQSLLPEGSNLLPIPSSILSALSLEDNNNGEQTHLVALELGYQKNTGPLLLPFGLNFSEAKLEIPFVSHPRDESTPYLLKQTILFSNTLLANSSNMVAGLKSHKATFLPKGVDTPRNVPADSSEPIQYSVQDFLESTFEPASSTTGGPPEPEFDLETLRALTTLFHSDWFGHKSGGTITRFEFARLSTELPHTAVGKKDAEIGPRRYVASEPIRVRLNAFRHGPSAESSSDTIEVPKGTKAWRVRAQFRSWVRSV
ncbi:hypothetical protein CF319_g5959 [Tilletia indica]|nr:hypothetical protein CF319_g5959 [Tilletia indica]